MNDTITRSTPAAARGRMRLFTVAVLAAAGLAAGCTRGIEDPGPKGARVASMTAAPMATATTGATPAVQVVDTASVAPSPGGPAPASIAMPASAPAEPDPAAANRREVLSAPLTFSLTARAMHKTLQLRSEESSGEIGFLCAGDAASDGGVPGGSGDRTMKISRFAQYGHTDTIFLFQWVVSMENDQGRLTGRRVVKDGKKGYEVTLTGRLGLQVLIKSATQPLRMLTRKDAVLKGFSPTWPPYGATLVMQNGPADFYMEKNINDTSLAPFVVVSEAQAAIGRGPSGYFEKTPRITRASVLGAGGAPWKQGDVGGVRLEWSATGPTAGTTAISGYNIYRGPAAGGAWRRIASVPATQTSYEDTSFDGREPARYFVAHRTELPISFEYEGSPAAPTLVKAVTR